VRRGRCHISVSTLVLIQMRATNYAFISSAKQGIRISVGRSIMWYHVTTRCLKMLTLPLPSRCILAAEAELVPRAAKPTRPWSNVDSRQRAAPPKRLDN
jgi:hypothetical protein